MTQSKLLRKNSGKGYPEDYRPGQSAKWEIGSASAAQRTAG